MPRLDIPSRQDVEACIRGLQIEDAREAAALRLFYARCRAERRRKRARIVVAVLAGLAILWWWASR